MALRIDRVETEMEILPEKAEGMAPAAGLPASDSALRERLRPLVLEIIEQELGRLRRERG